MESIKNKFLNTTEIDIKENLDYQDFFEHYLNQSKPVIIKNGLGDMPALKKWNIEYFQEKIGDKNITLSGHHAADIEWTMNDFFNDLLDTKKTELTRYLTQANIVRHFPELIDDVKPYPTYGLPDWKCNSLLPKDMLYDSGLMELLLGKTGSGFFAHYDRGFIHAFIGQVYGEKQIILIPPKDNKYVYPQKNRESRSDVDFWNLNLEKYPEVINASPCFYTLKPGDLVFLPSGWWHTTRNKTISIGITFNSVTQTNWKPFCNYVIDRHKNSKNNKYPTWLFSAVLKSVGYIELAKQLVLGVKPRNSNTTKVWDTDIQ